MYLMTSSDSKGVPSMDGVQDTKSIMNEQFLAEGHGSVCTNWSSYDNVMNGILRSDEGTGIGNVASFTSVSFHNNRMKGPMIPTQDSCVGDHHEGQANHLKSVIWWIPPEDLAKKYADGLPPKSISAASINPVSGPSGTLQAGTTHNPNPSGFEQSNKTYVVPTDRDVLCGHGGEIIHHPGNQRYLKKISEFYLQYEAAAKANKKDVSQTVVDAVHAWGGCFVKLEKGTKEKRYEISDKARKKASQALHDYPTKTTAGKREYQALGNDNMSENRKRKCEKSAVVSQMKK